jgi:hypothetical protein
MQLQFLRDTLCLTIYYDTFHQWLFLDWAGELTLSAVQDAGVAVAECYLHGSYPRVLSSNLQLTEIDSSVGAWLKAEFLPYLTIAGVTQMAWVSAPSVGGRKLTQTVANRVSGLALNAFETAAEAIAWLQQTPCAQPEDYSLPPRQTGTQALLTQSVQVIRQEMQIVQQEVQQLQQKVKRKAVASARA